MDRALMLNLATAAILVSGWSLVLWKLYRGLEETRVARPGTTSRADAARLPDQESLREAVDAVFSGTSAARHDRHAPAMAKSRQLDEPRAAR